MTDSITVTREQVEGALVHFLGREGYRLGIGQYDIVFRDQLARSFTTALFNNVKVGEEGEVVPPTLSQKDFDELQRKK